MENVSRHLVMRDIFVYRPFASHLSIFSHFRRAHSPIYPDVARVKWPAKDRRSKDPQGLFIPD